jgi:hypothetical protein
MNVRRRALRARRLNDCAFRFFPARCHWKSFLENLSPPTSETTATFWTIDVKPANL